MHDEPIITSAGAGDTVGRLTHRRVRLSRQLAQLAAGFAAGPVRIGELTDVLQLRGYNALLLFLALPFVAPVPLPGLSTLFGLVIALLGLRMALAQKPWLPERFTSKELPSRLLPKLLLAASSALRRLERFLKPRFFYPDYSATFQRASGGIILVSGLLLLLPLPVPFSNAFPAFTIILLAAAGLQRDGAFFLAGCAQFLLSLGFFAALAFGGAKACYHFFQ